MSGKQGSKWNIYLSASQIPDLHSKNLLPGNPLYCTHISKDYANIQICRNIWTNAFKVSTAHIGIRIKRIKTCGGEQSYLNGNIMENIIFSIIILLSQSSEIPVIFTQEHSKKST